MTTYTTKFYGDTYTVSGNFAEGSAPVLFDGEPTQYQTADFRHSPERAMRRQLEQVATDSGSDPEDDEVAASIKAAIEAMREVEHA